MIVDTLANAHRYDGLHPLFPRAFDFLRRTGLGSLAAGRHEIDGTRLFVSIDHKEGRGSDGARLEVHRRYIDIQFTFEGAEEIGWTPLADCRTPASAFDEDRDLGFFDDRATTWIEVPPGRFAIFFPEDAHAPLGGHGLLKKAIVKIAVE